MNDLITSFTSMHLWKVKHVALSLLSVKTFRTPVFCLWKSNWFKFSMGLSALANRNLYYWNKLEFQINNNYYFSLCMSHIRTYFYKIFYTEYTKYFIILPIHSMSYMFSGNLIRERFRLCLFIFSDDFILVCLLNQTFQGVRSLSKEQRNTTQSHGVFGLGLSLTRWTTK